MLTPVRSAAVLSAFIVVSGHAAVAATRIALPDGRDVLASHPQTVRWIGNGGSDDEPVVNRCHATHKNGRECRMWIHLPAGAVLDGRLGWRGYCQQCVEVFAAECRRRYKRMPVLGREFFCPYCLKMRADPDDRCPRESDGRRRVKCLHCRRVDFARRIMRQKRNGNGAKMVLR